MHHEKEHGSTGSNISAMYLVQMLTQTSELINVKHFSLTFLSMLDKLCKGEDNMSALFNHSGRQNPYQESY